MLKFHNRSSLLGQYDCPSYTACKSSLKAFTVCFLESSILSSPKLRSQSKAFKTGKFCLRLATAMFADSSFLQDAVQIPYYNIWNPQIFPLRSCPTSSHFHKHCLLLADQNCWFLKAFCFLVPPCLCVCFSSCPVYSSLPIEVSCILQHSYAYS